LPDLNAHTISHIVLSQSMNLSNEIIPADPIVNIYQVQLHSLVIIEGNPPENDRTPEAAAHEAGIPGVLVR
jgi:hypothetical protein